MKKVYIKPETEKTSMVVENAFTVSADVIPRASLSYGWNPDDFFPQTGGSSGYTGGGNIGWRSDEEIDGDNMFARGTRFGSLWD